MLKFAVEEYDSCIAELTKEWESAHSGSTTHLTSKIQRIPQLLLFNPL